MRCLDQEIDCRRLFGSTPGSRHLDPADAISPVDEGRGSTHREALLCQSMGLARKDRDLGMAQ